MARSICQDDTAKPLEAVVMLVQGGVLTLKHHRLEESVSLWDAWVSLHTMDKFCNHNAFHPFGMCGYHCTLSNTPRVL